MLWQSNKQRARVIRNPLQATATTQEKRPFNSGYKVGWRNTKTFLQNTPDLITQNHWNNQWTLIFTSQTGGQIPPGGICSKWEDTQWQKTNIANLLASILLWDVTQFKAFYVKAITAILCTKCKIHMSLRYPQLWG